ncbi:MarR family transcriptional regulator [Altererythrobacter sp. B11]|uniref:MarR family winged helix-turn-helix transcriptional regulator n=1 Tax=Altererythrobacter sp. B11 TaxID=2060312 RepID=UPI000DC71B60|nr:MarR family winged helix-turn-helix transcriptional regulator [Altererythrobacter sp. B11]BBC71908.1 MarR family transcriptional regulator [Altererythrobacter sp. B11]
MADIEPLISAYAELYLELTRKLDRRMASEGASLARTKLLLCLQKRGPMRGTDVAELFGLAPRTITEAIDGLERDGLVERQPDPTDRRAKLIRVTGKGIEAAATTEPMRRQFVSQIFGVLDEQEQAALLGMLRRLIAAIPDS